MQQLLFLKTVVTTAPQCLASHSGKQLRFCAKIYCVLLMLVFSFQSAQFTEGSMCKKLRWIVYTTNCQILPCQILPALLTQHQFLLQSINTQLPGKAGTPCSSSVFLCEPGYLLRTVLFFTFSFSPSPSVWPHPQQQQVPLSWANSQPSTSPALSAVIAEAVKAKKEKLARWGSLKSPNREGGASASWPACAERRRRRRRRRALDRELGVPG